MRRAVLLVTLGATLAIAYWTWAPTGLNQPTSAARSADLTATEAVVARLDSEVSRLATRTASSDGPTAPQRNPFRFPAAAPAAPTPTISAPPPVVAPAPRALPTLVAITAKTTPGGVVRSAALSMGEAVVVAHPGDTVGDLVVRAIADGFVELVDPASGTAYRVR